MIKKSVRKEKLPNGMIIPLNFDFMFSGIFNDEDNLIIVENFLALYLNKPIDKIKNHVEIKSRDIPIKNKSDKNKQIDLLLNLDGEKINIELSNRMSEGVKERNVVYASEIHGRSLKYSDNDYKEINRTLQICLNNFKCNEEKFIDTYYLRNEDGKILSQKLQIDYVDLVKAEKKIYNEKEEKLARFCRALTCKSMKKFKEELGGIMEKEAENKLIEEVDKYSRDDDVVALYSAYSREELERNTYIKEAKEQALEEGHKEGFEKGHKEGLAEGRKEEKKEIAKNLLKINVSISDISKATGLTKEEIIALQ